MLVSINTREKVSMGSGKTSEANIHGYEPEFEVDEDGDLRSVVVRGTEYDTLGTGIGEVRLPRTRNE